MGLDNTAQTRTASGLGPAVLANLPLPVGWTVGSLVAWWLKSTNPDDIDVTQGLAYLRPILLSGFGALALTAVVALVVALRARRTGNGLPLNLLLVHAAVTIVVLVANGLGNAASG